MAVIWQYQYDKEEFNFSFETKKMVVDFEDKTWSNYRDGYLYAVMGHKSTVSCN